MANYSKTAATVLRLLKAKGAPVSFARAVAVVDGPGGNATETVVTSDSWAALLPLSSASDFGLEAKAVVGKETALLMVAAKGMTLIPRPLDTLSFGGFVWSVISSTSIDPTGVEPVVFGMQVWKLGAPLPEPPAPEPVPGEPTP